MKYIDVTRTTHTTLDVLQECRVDDYQNIDPDDKELKETINKTRKESWKVQWRSLCPVS